MARVVAPSSSSGTAGRGGGGGGGIVRSGRVRRNSVDLTSAEDMTVPIGGDDENNEDSQSIPSLDGHDSDQSCSDSESSDCEGHSSSDEDVSEDEEDDDDDDDDRKNPPVDSSGMRNGKRPATPISSPASLQLQGSYKKARQSQSQSEEPSQQSKKNHHPRHVSSLASTDESTTAKFYRPTLQAIAPTLAGIQELVHHLRLHHPSLRRHGNGGGGGGGNGGEGALTKVQRTDPRHQTSLIALPTECTYEVCSLVSWSKNEVSNKDDENFRTRQLDHLKSAASNEVLHVYVPHQNIQLLDKLLDFPKKKYALKRCPNDISNFNESRVIFQRLADLFWPGACIIYLSPESQAPSGLVQKHVATAKNGQRVSKPFIGFRCPSHPLTVRVQKQLQQSSTRSPLVLVGSSVREGSAIGETIEGTIEGYSSSSDSSTSVASSPLLKAKDVIRKFGESISSLDSTVRVLQGEERKEIFAVPTCQFEDVVLECWIDAPSRQITLKGRSKRTVQARHVLTPSNTKNAVLRSVLQHWKVVDERNPRADVAD